jgi:DNA-binding transcriptional LysR family regulator
LIWFKIDVMNLRAIDLNLLVALDALLAEAHVSRAAARVGLSQPAMSNALERCRHVFQDPLLERDLRGMRLTPKALALRDPLRGVLADVRALLQPPAPDLATLRQTVHVLLPDVPPSLLLQPLLTQLAQSAPLLQIVIHPWHGAEAALASLLRGELDLAVSVLPQVLEAIHRVDVSVEHYCVAMRLGHPAADRFNLETWLAYPHVLVSGHGDTSSPLDARLRQLGHQRHIGVVVPSFLAVPAVLHASDCIALLPQRCLPPDTAPTLVLHPPPLAVDSFTLHLAWHQRRAQDPAVQHVAQLITRLLRVPSTPA